jgi:hypothetical protein
VLNQVNGTWQQPALQITLPYDACLNDPKAIVTSVSTSAPGYAVAGGIYNNISNSYESFVINQVNGIWQQPAIKVPGSSFLNIKEPFLIVSSATI